MTQILKSNLLKFNSDTLNDVRQEFNLNEPGSMTQNIDILHDWIQKQEHFTKKDFGKEYLERFIISAKGSVEKAETRISKLCTMRTVAPNLFESCHAKNDLPKLRDFLAEDVARWFRAACLHDTRNVYAYLDCIRAICTTDIKHNYLRNLCTKHNTTALINSLLLAQSECDLFANGIARLMTEWKRVLEREQDKHLVVVMMPELTEDNYRILCSKMFPTKITSANYLEAYQHCVMICEYMKLHDYAKGYYLIIDLKDVNIKNLVTNLNLIDFRNILTLIIEGYGVRIKGIHIISSSTVINTLVKIVKLIVSTKIGKRINVFKSVESLHTIFSKHLLPEDFGGEQKSILELFDEMNEELSSDSHILHMMEMKQACIDKNLQRSDKFNEEYIGMPRSLELLNID